MACRRFTGKTVLVRGFPLASTYTGRFANNDALREMKRTLKPGASFGAIWNIEDCKPRRHA